MPVSNVLTAKHSMAVLLLVLIFASPVASHAGQINITAILAAHPDLGEFSSLLASTGLADDIKQRNDGPITVLAVNDTAMSASLKAMPPEAIRSHLSLHILLHCYYDDAQLQRLPLGGAPTLVPTLFHASGDAPGVHGMVRIAKFHYDGVPVGFLFEPMAGAFFVKTVYGVPNSVSVLQVSRVMSPITPDAARRH